MNPIREIPFILGPLAASATASTSAIDLGAIANEWKFSVQYEVTDDGDGTATITLEALCSNDGINYVAYGTTIITDSAVAAMCLPDTFTPPLCRFMKLQATETSGAGTLLATIKGVLCIQ